MNSSVVSSTICIINVAINRTLDLATPYSTLPWTESSMTNRRGNVFAPSRNPNVAKWEILFDKKIAQWLSFKPQLGLQVYPCYACRDIFGSKNSFLDHVNRRGMLLKYKCSYCTASDIQLFYNPCSFLLHTRQHYNLLGGQINLDCLEVSVLPYGLGGFLPDPSVPMIYNVEDDNLGEATFINSRFYNPVPDSMGQAVVTLVSNELLFFFTSEPNALPTSLVLKQISSNIPRCQFVTLDNNRFIPIPNGVDITGKELIPGETNNNFMANSNAIKEEPQESVNHTSFQYDLPIISKTETINDEECESTTSVSIPTNKNTENFPSCPECGEVQTISMGEHFLKTDNPFHDSLKCSICKYIAPTKCSLQAHERIHESIAPYVCPECGKDFEDWGPLHAHLEEVCFHLTKQVRLRCPGRKCGKIFAQIMTFSAHFLAHMQCLCQCTICPSVFYNENEFLVHNVVHSGKAQLVKIYKCTVCSHLNETYTVSDFQEHIYEHATKRKQRLYVYICKRCHSYFRSTLTYATHLLRCSKPMPQSNAQIYTKSMLIDVREKQKSTCLQLLGMCVRCKTQIKLQAQHYDNAPVKCPNCGDQVIYKDNMNLLHKRDLNDESNSRLVGCILCQKRLTSSEMQGHLRLKQCKYQNSTVLLDSSVVDEYFSTKDSPKSIETYKKKRKRMSNNKFRKLSISNSETDLSMEADEPIPFDGTYCCKSCDFTSTDREVFHEHIIAHRDVSTAYQCMECGECFVVKPSLIKHLLYYHQVTDIDTYFSKNSCFDKEAVKELENIMRLAPGESKEPVAANQCRVCLLEFNDELELNKHFRVHGMAFLLKNSK